MSFRNNHPVLLGLLILAGIFLLFWGGISLLFTSALSQKNTSDLFSKKEGIGVVELKGLIVSPEETLETLSTFRRKSAVKAIIVRIDSPGGAVGASQEIFTEILRTNTVKPIVASLASVAASGGYYAALGAEKIIANPGTLTGSIGVIVKFSDFSDLFEKIGYKNEVVKSGLMKDIGAIDRPMDPAERQLLQDLIDNVHAQFVNDVAKQRQLPLEKVKELADGRIFSGEQAFEAGLVDSLGNFTEAVSQAAILAGLDDTDPHLIYPEKNQYPLFDLLTGRTKDQMFRNFFEKYLPMLSYEWTGWQ